MHFSCAASSRALGVQIESDGDAALEPTVWVVYASSRPGHGPRWQRTRSAKIGDTVCFSDWLGQPVEVRLHGALMLTSSLDTFRSAGESDLILTARHAETAALHGQVLDAGGRPLADALLSLINSSSACGTLPLEPDGTFDCGKLPCGDCRLFAHTPLYGLTELPLARVGVGAARQDHLTPALG